MTVPIIEIFKSIEGEGKRSGKLCTFIRTAGCNLRCSYCDTKYSYNEDEATQIEIEEILWQVGLLKCPNVTITGGEPLIHEEVKSVLIPELLMRGYCVNIETNGSILLKGIRENAIPEDRTQTNLFYTMDWKSVSSRMNSRMIVENLIELKEYDVLKFVVGSNVDLLEVKDVIEAYKIKAQIYISPVFGEIEMKKIVEFMKSYEMNEVKLQVQLHKIIWSPEKRGV